MKKVNLDQLRSVPILDVAERLGIEIVHSGSSYAMRDAEDGSHITSLTVFPSSNRWKRWSGIERGGVSGGGTIDLVMHIKNTSDVSEAVRWLSDNFSSHI